MNEIKNFPFTYDQFQRYSVLREFLKLFYPGEKCKVLDVGGLSPDRDGKSSWLPIKQIFSGDSVTLDLPLCKEESYIQGNGSLLPFKNGSFEVVSALDVIEHITATKREEFIRELCRVSKGSVVISAPFKDDGIEKAEELLFKQIKLYYGMEHGQLKEHKKFGLPDKENISKIISRYTSAGTGFSFGSLQNWFVLQSIKNGFMFKRNSAKIQYYLDKWFASRNFESESKSPFSRHFWIFSKDISKNQLESFACDIENRLKQEAKIETSFKELQSFHQEILDFHCKSSVSALIVSTGKTENLDRCLKHVTTQKADFDIEVAVWDIKQDQNVERMVKSSFPGVKYFTQQQGGKTTNSLLKTTGELEGDYILLITENILLPEESLDRFYRYLQERKESCLLSPRVVRDNRFYSVWAGGRLSLKQVLAGKIFNPFWQLKKNRLSWIFSECLFFKREALFERKFRNNALKKNNVFLWKKIKTGRGLLYCRDFIVYRKR